MSVVKVNQIESQSGGEITLASILAIASGGGFTMSWENPLWTRSGAVGAYCAFWIDPSSGTAPMLRCKLGANKTAATPSAVDDAASTVLAGTGSAGF